MRQPAFLIAGASADPLRFGLIQLSAAKGVATSFRHG